MKTIYELPAHWLTFPCHSIRADRLCTCGKTECEHPGKHPRTRHGFKDATCDPAKIAAWRRRLPDANWAVATGEASGIFVLDTDPRNAGDESLAALVANHGELPTTVTAETGGGGLHPYFKYPDGVKISCRTGLMPGIDIKSDGGYVILPGSNHVSGGQYRWAEGRAPGQVEIAQPPSWLLELLTCDDAPGPAPSANGSPKKLQRAQAYVAEADSASKGTRNKAAFNLAGHLASFDHSEAEALTLLAPWNMRNDPPLEMGELRTCVANAFKYGTLRAPKGDDFDDEDTDAPAEDEAAQDASLRKIGGEEAEGLRLVKVLCDPVIWELLGPLFARAGGRLRLENNEFYYPGNVERVSMEQANTLLPNKVKKQWRRILKLLLKNMTERQPLPHEDKKAIIAREIFQFFESNRYIYHPPRSKRLQVTKASEITTNILNVEFLADGTCIFNEAAVVRWVIDEIPGERIIRRDVTGVLAAAGYRDCNYGPRDRRRHGCRLTPAGLQLLAKTAMLTEDQETENP